MAMARTRHSPLVTSRRLMCFCSWLRKTLTIFATFVCLVVVFAFVMPLRNLILYPVWPNAWRHVSTLDIISIKLFTQTTIDIPAGVPTCSSPAAPPLPPSVVDATKVRLYGHLKKSDFRSKEHQRFFPLLADEHKISAIHLYLVAAEALKQANVEFFLVEGSLLGAHRHHGMVPWDDDIDIAVNVSHWRTVRQVLSCRSGYVLRANGNMHWKFFPNSTKPRYGFPFIDIFFYTGNEDYIWAVTHYLVQTVIFPKSDTFPLATAMFEGLSAPVPKNTDALVRRVFDYEWCQSPSYNHVHEISLPSTDMSYVKCSSLDYLFHMHHLKY